MFEKNTNFEKYTRTDFTYAERLYDNYISMRKEISKIENYKYSVEDKYINNEDFKQGFLAGVKIMSSFMFDI